MAFLIGIAVSIAKTFTGDAGMAPPASNPDEWITPFIFMNDYV